MVSQQRGGSLVPLFDKAIELCKLENLQSPDWQVTQHAVYIYNLIIFGSVWIVGFRRGTVCVKDKIKMYFFKFSCESLYTWFVKNFHQLFEYLNCENHYEIFLREIGYSVDQFLIEASRLTFPAPPTPPPASAKPGYVSPRNTSGNTVLRPPELVIPQPRVKPPRLKPQSPD